MPLLAAVAVALSTAMVLITWSIMGGFLDTLLTSGKTMKGDMSSQAPSKLYIPRTPTGPTMSGTSPEAVIAAGEALRSAGTAVYAVGLGRDVDAELLARLASGPSRLILAPRAEDLARIYAELARDLPCDRP